MSVWSKIGKFAKKALPIAAGIGSMFIPGVGAALGPVLSGMFSGIGGGPVELKGDGSEGGSGWWSGIGNAVGGLLNSDFASSYGPGLVSGGLSYLGGRETNALSLEEAQRNRDFQAAQAQQQMAYQSDQAARSMQFSSGEALRQMDFSAAQAQLNRDFQERMANTAQQRGAADMRAAGFNPMLSFMKGGADVPSGAVAQGASGAGAMGQGASGHGAQAQITNALGGAVSSALSGVAMQRELDNSMANRSVLHAQALESQARALESATRLPKIQAETIQSQVNAERSEFEIQQIRTNIARMEAEMERVKAETQGRRLSNEQQAYYNLFIQQLDRQIKGYQVKLMSLGVPRAANEAEAQDTWWMQRVSPFLPDVLRGTSSAAQFGRAFSH